MKPSIPLQLFLVCVVAILILSSFRFGAHYAARPYRAWFADTHDREKATRESVQFTEIAVQQSHSLLLVSYALVGFHILGLGFLTFHHFRRKEPVQFPVPARSIGT